ncbi:MAG: hypothetical protein ACO3EZ_03500 [Prochlorotrichaceae cyanobacterium]
MTVDRLAQVEKNITRLQEQLIGIENALVTAPAEDKVRLRQRIADIQEEIKSYEREKDELLGSSLNFSRESEFHPQSEGPDPYQDLLDWLLQRRSKAFEEEKKELKSIFFIRSIAIVIIWYSLILTIDAPRKQNLELPTLSPIVLVGSLAYGYISWQQKQIRVSKKLEKLESLELLKVLYIFSPPQHQQDLQTLVLSLVSEKFDI